MIHIVGIVGLPSRYGGFETLVENLVKSEEIVCQGVTVYCESKLLETSDATYKGITLKPLSWKANGWQSILYDTWGMVHGSLQGGQVLILGTSATFILPLLRAMFPRVRYYVNMAGLEWKRSKWGGVAKLVLKVNEWAAVKFAHRLIADNEGLVEYVQDRYGADSIYIPYGGDQYLTAESNSLVFDEWHLPQGCYDFAIARAQYDNNLELILTAYARTGYPLVFVSNWESADFGRKLKYRFSNIPNLHLIGPIYDVGRIKAIQTRTRLYIHGHSAGGTNPSLVEAMWGGLATYAFDVSFNRHTTNNQARYFCDVDSLAQLLDEYDSAWAKSCAETLHAIAERKFTWAAVRSSYSNLLRGNL